MRPARARQGLSLAVLSACLALPAAAEWTSWSLGSGSAPALTPDGARVVYLRSLPEGWALLSCGLDGSGAIAHAGARSLLPDVALTAADAAAPVALAEAGAVALVGGRLLVLLSGQATAQVSALIPNTSPACYWATAAGEAVVAAVLGDGSVLLARPSTGPVPISVPLPDRATSVSLSADGSRVLARGEGRSWLLESATGAVLLDPPGALSGLSGDGRRCAYVEGGALHRAAPGRPEKPTLSPPAYPVHSVALDGAGRGVYLHAGDSLWRLDWAGDQFRPVVPLESGERYALSDDGRTVAYGSAGEIHVASADRAEPPATAGVRIETPRRLPSLEAVLPDLAALAEEIARRGGAMAPSGLIAGTASTGWGLYRQASPPVAVRVPPEWRVEPRPDGRGFSLLAPRGSQSVELWTLREVDTPPADWAASVAASRDWGELDRPTDALLGGVEGLTWHVAIPESGDTAFVSAARWADGLVGVVARFAGGEAPPDVRAVLESISPEPWSAPPAP